MSIAEQISLMEQDLEEIKKTKDIHAKLLRKKLYKYENYEEEGYVLAENEADARGLVVGENRYDITEIMSHEQLMVMINSGAVTTYLLPF